MYMYIYVYVCVCLQMCADVQVTICICTSFLSCYPLSFCLLSFEIESVTDLDFAKYAVASSQ